MSSTKVSHPLFARGFDRTAYRLEERGQREHRQRLLTGLTGRVIEVGAGNGLNFPHYPQTVTEVVAVEPEPYLRKRAAEAAAEAPIRINIVDGTADELPAETRPSTPLSPRSSCARFPTRRARSPSYSAC